ncbi:hypothetical protein L0F63_004520, partial [Massospora cicadina]
AIKCYERYEKLTEEDKATYNTTGKFPEVAASLMGQIATPERAEKDRVLALACVTELIRKSDGPQSSLGEGFVDGCYCKDNRKLSFIISRLPQINKLVPNSGLTKCFKRWSKIYPGLDLFTVEDLNARFSDVQVAKEMIDKHMRPPSEIVHSGNVTAAPHKHWRKGIEDFKYDVALVAPLSEDELRVEAQEYLDVRSIKTRLAIENSDLDLNITLPKDEMSFEEVEGYLEELVEILKGLEMTKIRVIHRKGAKVPLIKCLDPSSLISIDLSFGSSTTIFKTALLAAYARLHPTVRQLLLFIKGWAAVREVNLPNNGTLNTYCHSTMLLAYLVMVGAIPNLQRICLKHSSFSPAQDQTCVKVVDPTVAKCHVCGDDLPTKFYYGSNVYFNDLRFTFNGELDFLDLIRGYMFFMGYSFKCEVYAISLLRGGLVPRETTNYPMPSRENVVLSLSAAPQAENEGGKPIKIDEVKFLIVEDPIDVAVNVATSGRPWSVDGLNWEFRRASYLLKWNQPFKKSLLVPFASPPSPHLFIKEGIYSRYDFL